MYRLFTVLGGRGIRRPVLCHAKGAGTRRGRAESAPLLVESLRLFWGFFWSGWVERVSVDAFAFTETRLLL